MKIKTIFNDTGAINSPKNSWLLVLVILYMENINVSLLILVWFGAFCAMAFSVTSKGFKGLMPLLKKIFPKLSDRWLMLFDILISPVLGALFIYFIMQPNNMKDAVLEGLTWSGTFVALAKNKED